MESKIKKIGVFTSGGDSPGMNACVRSVVRAASYHGIEVVGFMRAYDGIIQADYIDLNARSVANIIHRGGTVLKSARSKAFRTVEGRRKAFETCQSLELDALVAIGGDGTFTGANIFSQEYGIPVIGAPGTIDNDLFGTDQTIGYTTALETAVDAIDKIRDTAESHNRLFFVEVMGRDAGFIALRSAIAGGALTALVPEFRSDVNQLIDKIDSAISRGRKSLIVVVAEGEEHGGALEMSKIVKSARPDMDIKVSILGHIQRGGSPCVSDRILATTLGAGAVNGLLAGQSNCMVGMVNNQIKYTPFDQAIKHHKELNQDLLDLLEQLSV